MSNSNPQAGAGGYRPEIQGLRAVAAMADLHDACCRRQCSNVHEYATLDEVRAVLKAWQDD